MLMDIWARIGAFVSEYYETGLIVGFILLAVALVAQIILNSEIESNLIDLVDRVEVLEAACGIEETDADEATVEHSTETAKEAE